MKRLLSGSLCAVLSFAFLPWAWGEESAPTPLEPVVVTATRTEVPLGQVGSSVTVITQEEIRTRQGQGGPRLSLFGEGGTYKTSRMGLSVQGAREKLSFSSSLSRDCSGGIRVNDDNQNTTLPTHLTVEPLAGGSFHLISRYTRAKRDVSNSRLFFNPRSKQKTDSWAITGKWDQALTDWWDWRLQLSPFENDLEWQDPTFHFFSRIDTQTTPADLRTNFHLGPYSLLTLGGEWERQKGKNSGAFNDRVISRAFYAQNQLKRARDAETGRKLIRRPDHRFGLNRRNAVTPIAYALWMLCCLGTAVFATATAGWRLAIGAFALGFVGAAGLMRPERPSDAVWVGSLVAVTAGLQLLWPGLSTFTAGCGGILAGLSAWFLRVEGLPKTPALVLAAILPVVSFYLSARRPAFAPAELREEALLTILVIGLAVAVAPEISAGWRSALALNIEEKNSVNYAPPAWVLLWSSASGMLGGFYSLWRRR